MGLDAKRFGFFACVVAVVVAAAVALVRAREEESVAEGSAADAPRAAVVEQAQAGGGVSAPAEGGAEASAEKSDEPETAPDPEPEEQKSEEELRQEEEEKKVEAFDAITDKWMEKEGGEVTMKDMDEFVAAFRSVPAGRKEECLHRALNLVSDDHVLLLAGILFDKTAEKEHVELVFNDILNRDEEVKKLILPKIFKDREHPCWADAAWILDVTGELPKKENNQ